MKANIPFRPQYKNIELEIESLKKTYRIRFKKLSGGWYLDKAFLGKEEMDAVAVLDAYHMAWNTECQERVYLCNQAITDKWISPDKLSVLAMGCKAGEVIDKGQVWVYVGIGWVPRRMANPGDFRDLPIIQGKRLMA